MTINKKTLLIGLACLTSAVIGGLLSHIAFQGDKSLKVALLPRSILVSGYLQDHVISNPEDVMMVAKNFDKQVMPVVSKYESDGYLIVDSYRQGNAYLITHLPEKTVDLTNEITPLLGK